jgi:hypothetical protein
MDFPSKKNGQTKKPESDGQKFLTNAKERHAEIFQSFLAKADEFPSVDEYTDAIEKESWKFTELLTKESWRNGLARGQARKAGVS